MSVHGIAEAKTQLSRLIDRALEGDTVVITRHGAPVAELKACARRPQAMTKNVLDWLDRVRVTPTPGALRGANVVAVMRDEDDARLPGR